MIQAALALVRMSRWSLVVLAVATTAIGARLAGIPTMAFLWVPLAVSNGLLSAASMLFNDWHDVAEDRINRPTRQLPLGLVSRRTVLLVTLGLFGSAALLAYLVSPGLALAASLVALISVAYSVALKRVPFVGNLAVGALAAYPLWCWQLITVPSSVALSLSASCALFVTGKEILKTGEDALGDGAVGIRTIAVVFGVPAANRLGVSLMLAAVLLAWFPITASAATWEYTALLGVTAVLMTGLLAHVLLVRSTSPAVSGRYSMLGHAMLFVMVVAMAVGISPPGT